MEGGPKRPRPPRANPKKLRMTPEELKNEIEKKRQDRINRIAELKIDTESRITVDGSTFTVVEILPSGWLKCTYASHEPGVTTKHNFRVDPLNILDETKIRNRYDEDDL